MKVNIQLMKSKRIKKERNPGIKRAIDNALKAVGKNKSKCTVTMFVYIDGDPESEKIFFLN